jgi:hypothetical protein
LLKPDYMHGIFVDMRSKSQEGLTRPSASYMSDAERLRERSKRMLELASRAYCEGHYYFARYLLQLATEAFEHAGEMDRSQQAQPRQHAESAIPRS